MFMFDEDEIVLNDSFQTINYSLNNNLKEMKKNDNRIFGKNNKNEKNEFPTSFREFSLLKHQNEFDYDLF